MSPKSSLWRKKEPSNNKSQTPQQLCESGTLQDGGSSYSPRLNSITGLDGEIGPVGFISSSSDSSGPSTLPPISMGAGEIPVCMPVLRANISTNNETSGAATGHLSDGRTSARKGEFDGRQGVRNDEGSLWLDVESDHLQPDSASNGPTWVRSVCLLPNIATNKVLQLKTRPRSREHRCIQSRLVHHIGVCQPPHGVW